MLTLPLLVHLVAPALADSDSPYMWGVGANVGTIVIPGHHPIAFSKVDPEGDDTKERLDWEGTGGDVLLGVKGLLYLNKSNRFQAAASLGFGGESYRSSELTLEYQLVPVSNNGVEAFLGVGGGFGRMRWEKLCGDDTVTTCPDEINYPGELRFATYIIRGEAGGLYRNKSQAYGLNVFGELNFTGPQEFTLQGEEEAGEASGGFYTLLGLEGTFYFGDFRPPGSGKKKNKKNKGGDSDEEG